MKRIAPKIHSDEESSKPKVALSYSPVKGGQSVLSVKESFEVVGCSIKNADYHEMMNDIDPDFLAIAYESLEGRKGLFAHAKEKAKKILADCDCLAIPGNPAMIDPDLFNEVRANNVSYNFSRSIAEMSLVHEAMQKGMPIFGACGGHQVIAVYDKGTVRALSKKERQFHKAYRYDNIYLNIDSILTDIIAPEGICLIHSDTEPTSLNSIQITLSYQRAIVYVASISEYLYFVDNISNTIQKLTVSEAKKEELFIKLGGLPHKKRLDKIALALIQSMLDEKIKLTMSTFGSHYQAVDVLPSQFDLAAHGGGSIPEAICSKHHGIVLSTQFHPEVMWRGLKNSMLFNMGKGNTIEQKCGENIFRFLEKAAITYKIKKQLLADLRLCP